MVVPQWAHHRTCPHVPLTPSLCGSSTDYLHHKSCRTRPRPPKHSRHSLLDKGSYCTLVRLQGCHRTSPRVPRRSSLCGSSTDYLHHKSCRTCPRLAKHSRRSLLDNDVYCMPVPVFYGLCNVHCDVVYDLVYLHHKLCCIYSMDPNGSRRSTAFHCISLFLGCQDTLCHHAGHVFLHHDVVAVHPLHNACCMHPRHPNHAFDKGYGDAAAKNQPSVPRPHHPSPHPPLARNEGMVLPWLLHGLRQLTLHHLAARRPCSQRELHRTLQGLHQSSQRLLFCVALEMSSGSLVRPGPTKTIWAQRRPRLRYACASKGHCLQHPHATAGHADSRLRSAVSRARPRTRKMTGAWQSIALQPISRRSVKQLTG